MTEELSSEPIQLVVEARAHGWRVDHFLVRLYPNYSRSLFQKAIQQGAVQLNGLPVKAGRKLKVNDCLSVKLPKIPDSTLLPEDIPLDILYEDDSLVVLNKAANMVVHPGKGNYRGTLAGALQHHFDKLSDVAGQLRPGIVHRLDRDTSGVIVIAKDNQVHNRLSSQFEKREVKKEYRAIVWGELEYDSDYIETLVRVHPKQREKMMVCEPGGNARSANTFYEAAERFHGFTYVKLLPKTGRTHQLRVHMKHLKHPIVSDKLYGGQDRFKLAELVTKQQLAEDDELGKIVLIHRQALHAFRLEFTHPESNKPMQFEAPLPQDMQKTLTALREYRSR